MLSIFLVKSLVNGSLKWLVLMENSVMLKVYVIKEHVMLLEWQILAWPFVVKIPAPNVRTIQKHMKNISVNFGKAKATVNRISIDSTTTHTLASWQKIVRKPVDFVQKNNKLVKPWSFGHQIVDQITSDIKKVFWNHTWWPKDHANWLEVPFGSIALLWQSIM